MCFDFLLSEVSRSSEADGLTYVKAYLGRKHCLIYPGHSKYIGIQREKRLELTRSNPATAITLRVRCALMIQTQLE
jgi:hypothetical protein